MFLLDLTGFEIFKLVCGIIMLPIMFYLFSILFGYIFGGLSKLSGKTLVRHGNVVATPDTIDGINEDLKEKKDAAVKILGRLKEVATSKIDSMKSAKVANVVADAGIDKIEKLKQVEVLRLSGVINQQEFEILKKEILSK